MIRNMKGSEIEAKNVAALARQKKHTIRVRIPYPKHNFEV